jgi:hypothetical protein
MTPPLAAEMRRLLASILVADYRADAESLKGDDGDAGTGK